MRMKHHNFHPFYLLFNLVNGVKAFNQSCLALIVGQLLRLPSARGKKITTISLEEDIRDRLHMQRNYLKITFHSNFNITVSSGMRSAHLFGSAGAFFSVFC
jgi:hypothetical protein